MFLTGGYGAGSAMIKVERQPNGCTVTELWKAGNFGSTLSQPVIHEGHIYLNKGFKNAVHGMCCVTLDGQLKWETGQSPNFDMGPVFLADALLLAINGSGGDLVIIEPDPEGYKELARARVLGGNRVWAPIALADGKLLIRDQSKLVCVRMTE